MFWGDSGVLWSTVQAQGAGMRKSRRLWMNNSWLPDTIWYYLRVISCVIRWWHVSLAGPVLAINWDLLIRHCNQWSLGGHLLISPTECNLKFFMLLCCVSIDCSHIYIGEGVSGHCLIWAFGMLLPKHRHILGCLGLFKKKILSKKVTLPWLRHFLKRQWEIHFLTF